MSTSLVCRRFISNTPRWNQLKPAKADGVASQGHKIIELGSDSPLATLGVMIKASSRQENYNNAGIAHAMRLAAGLASQNFSFFRTTRQIQQEGGSLQVTQGREYTFYSLQVNKDHANDLSAILFDKVMSPSMKHWEIHDQNEVVMELELHNLTPDVITTEALHSAAFRTGLGQSLYVPKRNVDIHSSVDMKEWHAKYYNSANAVCVGAGVPNFYRVAEELSLGDGPATPVTPSKFCPVTENRIDANGPNAYVAIATETAGYADKTEALAAMLVQRILGARTPTKRGVGAGKLQTALKAALGDTPYGVTGLNYSYSDAGLLGAYIAVDAVNAGKATEAVVKTLRTLKVSEKDVAAAKKQLTVDQLENNDLHKAEMAAYSALSGTNFFTEDISSAINGVTSAQVQAVAKKLSAGKFAMGAYGNLSTVPYVDTL